MKQLVLLNLFCFFFGSIQSQSAPGQIISQLHHLNSQGRVLYIAAHPDDENTRLLSWLANERHYRTAYLSLTRGDGGQNLIGNEQSEELGLIRTQELIAARNTDGAEQFFTRAFDFGFSKNPEETFRIWDKEKILSDVVLVIRKFKPDVIIARFPTTGEGGHGHHTASAILAGEAFEAAADEKRFPESAKLYGTWKTKSLYWNNFRKWRDPKADVSSALKLDIGSYLPLLGESIGEISAKSRSQHKSQGFGVALQRGEILEYFDHLAGEKAQTEPFENLKPGWKNKAISDSIVSIIQQFNPQNPASSIPALTRLYQAFQKLSPLENSDHHVQLLQDIILQCAGFYGEFKANKFAVNPGEAVPVSFSCINRSNQEIKLLSTRAILPNSILVECNKVLTNNEVYTRNDTLKLPAQLAISNPYWLNSPHAEGLFTVNELSQIGKPESEAPIQIETEWQIGTIHFLKRFPLNYLWVDPVKGELTRRVEVLPAITATVNEDVFILNQSDHRTVEITIETSANSANIDVTLDLPAYFHSSPSKISVQLGNGAPRKQIIKFDLSANPSRETKQDAVFTIGVMMMEGTNKKELMHISRIDYDHIPIQTWIKPAAFKAVYVNLNRVGENIVYIPGADDKVGDCLKQAGYTVNTIASGDVTTEKLKNVDAVIIGIRAFNTNENMSSLMPILLAYVQQGGTLIEQYNTKNWISDVSVQPGPFPFEVSRERVTDENAPMKRLITDHPIFNTPNQITDQDFTGWIQERGLYFPEKWDSHYTALLECNDPGEKPLQGALIVTEYGKGKFIYTGLSFFRELPAGVPGAYRLFANMIAWGKNDGN